MTAPYTFIPLMSVKAKLSRRVKLTKKVRLNTRARPSMKTRLLVTRRNQEDETARKTTRGPEEPEHQAGLRGHLTIPN